jgi:hypothetical protein
MMSRAAQYKRHEFSYFAFAQGADLWDIFPQH